MLCNTSERETPGAGALRGATGTGASVLALRSKLVLRPNESLRASNDTVPTETAAAAAAAAVVEGGCVPASSGHGGSSPASLSPWALSEPSALSRFRCCAPPFRWFS